jgi:hypothetical protein
MRYALSLILLLCSPLAAAEFWISPTGSLHAPGTLSDPWDLRSALAQPPQVAPGDTLWLLPGLYKLQQPLVSRVSGTRNRPIKLRAQTGARVTLDCATASALARDATCLLIEGSHAWYEGFEIFNSREIRSAAAPGAPANPRGIGIQARSGPGVKLINLVIHDVGLAIFESQPSGIEIYGLIAYNNGWDGPDRSHGPGIYIRNKTAWPRKFIADSIVFQNYRQGLQGYGTGANVFSQMQLAGNIFFNNGIGRDGLHRNLMFGNERGDHVGNVLWENFTYFPHAAPSNGNLFGGDGGCRDLRLVGNIFASASQLNCLEGIEAAANTFYGKVSWVARTQRFAAAFPDNEFPERTSGLDIRIRRNRYDSQRLHAVVYNWDRLDVVQLDLSRYGVPAGALVEVRSAQNPFGEPLKLVYDGSAPAAVPMTGWHAALPIGWSADKSLPPTFPEFGAFVLTWDRLNLASY